MPQDKLGPLVRALVDLPTIHLDPLLRLIIKLKEGTGGKVVDQMVGALSTPEVGIALSKVPTAYRIFFESLMPEDRQWVFRNPRTSVPLFVEAVSRARVKSQVLTTESEFGIGAVEPFDSGEKFKVGTVEGVTIKDIFGTWDDFFDRHENATPPTTLKIRKASKSYSHNRIIAELADAADITLGQLWELLKMQDGIRDHPFAELYPNYVYIRSHSDRLTPVLVRKDGSKWVIGSGRSRQTTGSIKAHIVTR